MHKSIYMNILASLYKHIVEIRTTNRGWEEGSFQEYLDLKRTIRVIESYIGMTKYHDMICA